MICKRSINQCAHPSARHSHGGNGGIVPQPGRPTGARWELIDRLEITTEEGTTT